MRVFDPQAAHDIRVRCGYSTAHLARHINLVNPSLRCRSSTILGWEAGKVPRLDYLLALSESLGQPVEAFTRYLEPDAFAAAKAVAAEYRKMDRVRMADASHRARGRRKYARAVERSKQASPVPGA
jgi:hypothetical protein